MTDLHTTLASEIRALLEGVAIADRDGEALLIVRCACEGEAHEAGARERALALARRRAQGESLASLLGRVSFLGIEMLIEPGVIVPRVETELLGRTALELLRDQAERAPEAPLRVIDMCCGAGNLGCALGVSSPRAEVWASDLTEACARLTRRNVEHLGLTERVHVYQGDLFEPLAGLGLEGSIDVVVCNPPYISSGRLDGERAALWQHEPREAFDGGPYGLSIHQKVMRTALDYLRPGGWLLFEIGLGQDRQAQLLFGRARGYENVQCRSDDAGQPRVALARKKGTA